MMKTTKKIRRSHSKKLPENSSNDKKLEHEEDFFKWTRKQTNFLKKGEFEKLDIVHIIEEIESLGNSEKNAIENHMIILFIHLLKMKYQPTMRCKSWENSVENARFRIKRLIEKNPSLKKKMREFVEDAYFSARLQASSETGLDTSNFPSSVPWKMEELFPYLQKQVKKK